MLLVTVRSGAGVPWAARGFPPRARFSLRASETAEFRDEDHRALEREIDRAATQVAWPVDQEGGVVRDMDRTALAETEQRVLQTGGYAAVSTT
jgi:hypothetical protein